MTEYESIFIVQPGLSEEEVEAVAKGFEQVLTDQKATLVKSERWGKKRLAYRVRRHWDAYYIFFEFLGTHAALVELERRLRIHEHVIKFLSVRKDPRSAGEEVRRAERLAKLQRSGMPMHEGEERERERGYERR